MGSLVFACDAGNYFSRQTEFRGPDGREYYEGDYQIMPAPDVSESEVSEAFRVLNLEALVRDTDLIKKQVQKSESQTFTRTASESSAARARRRHPFIPQEGEHGSRGANRRRGDRFRAAP